MLSGEVWSGRRESNPRMQLGKRDVSQHNQRTGCKTTPKPPQSIQGVANQKQNGDARPVRAELIGSDTCLAQGIKARGAAPVLLLCRKLVEAGYDPDQPLEAWRGSILALRVRSIGDAAEVEINSKGTGLACRSAVRTASPVVRNDHTLAPAGSTSPEAGCDGR